MKFVVLGSSGLTVSCTTALLDAGADVCGLISMPQNISPNDTVDTKSFAADHSIEYREIEDVNSEEGINLIQSFYCDYIFSTWPKMIKKETLDLPRYFCIGNHPTELPMDRGRHTLHWLVAMGYSEAKMSFFRMNEGVDAGRVLAQIPYAISSDDLIVDVVKKMNDAAYKGTSSVYHQLVADPDVAGFEQDHSLANYWRKRTPHDITLDLRMSSSMILRTVQSFAPPYPGTNLIFEGNVIKITGASVSGLTNSLNAAELRRIEPGKILSIEGRTITVKVDDGIVELETMGDLPPRLLKAKYVHPPTKYITEYPDLLLEPA